MKDLNNRGNVVSNAPLKLWADAYQKSKSTRPPIPWSSFNVQTQTVTEHLPSLNKLKTNGGVSVDELLEAMDPVGHEFGFYSDVQLTPNGEATVTYATIIYRETGEEVPECRGRKRLFYSAFQAAIKSFPLNGFPLTPPVDQRATHTEWLEGYYAACEFVYVSLLGSEMADIQPYAYGVVLGREALNDRQAELCHEAFLGRDAISDEVEDLHDYYPLDQGTAAEREIAKGYHDYIRHYQELFPTKR